MNETIKDLVLYKPNQLIEVIGSPLSNLSLVTYNYILHKLQKEKANFIRLSLAELSTDIERNSHAYEDVYEVLKNLLEVKIVSIDKIGKSWGGFSLISAFRKENDCVYIEVPNLIINELLKQEEMYYTTIKLLEEKTFKCVYSIVFYEIFKKYEDVNLPIYTVEELRNLTETVEKYNLYYDFKKRVLAPALKEINSFDTKYIYDYEEEYLGRKVDKIKFFKKKKLSKEINVVCDEVFSPKFLKAIEKVRKNQYVDKKYSQRAVKKAVQQFGVERVIKAFKEMYKYNRTITSFSKFLNASISEIKENESLKKEIKKTVTVKEKNNDNINTEKTNETFDFSTFEGMRNFISGEIMNKITDIDMSKKLSILSELSKTTKIEELKDIVIKYNLEINLKLF